MYIFIFFIKKKFCISIYKRICFQHVIDYGNRHIATNKNFRIFQKYFIRVLSNMSQNSNFLCLFLFFFYRKEKVKEMKIIIITINIK